METYHLVRKELTLFSSKLSEKTELIALNKTDILDPKTSRKIAENLSKELSKPVYLISAVTGNNLKALIKQTANLIDKKSEDEHSYLSMPDEMNKARQELTF